MKKSAPWLGIALTVLMCLLVACGGESRADRGDVSETEGSAGPDVVPPACVDASTRIGVEPGRIDYIVRCRSWSMNNRPVFSVARYSLHNRPSPPGFRHIGRHPRVAGPGVVRPFAMCSRSGSVVYCSASSHGKVTIEGSIWVAPETRCELGVSVGVALVRRCGSDECPAFGGHKALVDGRPKGCA